VEPADQVQMVSEYLRNILEEVEHAKQALKFRG